MNGITRSDIDDCPKGFLAGRYRVLPAELPDTNLEEEDRPGEQIGTFAGLWSTLGGRTRGVLRGGYGLDEDGNRVFFGKYIDRQGHFRGLLTGTWEPAEEDARMLTEFNGRWVNRSGNNMGILGGHAYPVPEHAGGIFEGRWTELCDEPAEDEID